MKAKLIKILLEHDVSFRKVDEAHVNNRGCCLEGFSVMSQHVLGNSREEILQKMYDKNVEQRKILKKYNTLPFREDFVNSLLSNSKLSLNRKYTVRCTVQTNCYPILTHDATGKEWLKEKWIKDYTEAVPGSFESIECGFKWDIQRNNVEIDWSLWEKYRKLVIQWEAELKTK